MQSREAIPSEPVAYFLTWHTYGTWLHGHRQGSVDTEHAVFGEEFALANSGREKYIRQQMTHDPVILAQASRVAVQDAVLEVCQYRGWTMIALHLRTTHVHAVVMADTVVEKVLRDFKAYAPRRLRNDGLIERNAKPWSVHGSTKHLWDDAQIGRAVDDTVENQGDELLPTPFQHPEFTHQSPLRSRREHTPIDCGVPR